MALTSAIRLNAKVMLNAGRATVCTRWSAAAADTKVRVPRRHESRNSYIDHIQAKSENRGGPP